MTQSYDGPAPTGPAYGTPEYTTPTQGTTGYGTDGYESTSTGETAKQQAAMVAGDAKDEAKSVAADAKDAAGRVAGAAQDEARDLAAHAQHEARGLFQQARGEVAGQAGIQQDRLAAMLRTAAEELSGILDPNNTDYQRGLVTDLGQQASGRLQAATSWLENRQPAEVLDDMARFARRRPGTFLAAAAVAGLLVGRASRGMADDARQNKDELTAGPSRFAAGQTYGTQSYGTGRGYATGYAADPVGQDATWHSPHGLASDQPYAVPTQDIHAYGDGLDTTSLPGYDEPAHFAETDQAHLDRTQRFPATPEADTTYRPAAGTAYGEDSDGLGR